MFLALNSIAATASYVLGGRDRVVTLLLMRLAEWLMMGLMVYSSFWDKLQNAPSGLGLGSTGLQQVSQPRAVSEYTSLSSCCVGSLVVVVAVVLVLALVLCV